jgi:glutamine amidotransferase
MIAIIDYGMGNLGSIKNMLHRLGHESIVTSDASIIRNARKLILPGVGAFDRAMQSLDSRGLTSVLHEQVTKEKKHLLGICLGMQLLGTSSEEGTPVAGFGWINASVRQFRFEASLPKLNIPHMGWNSLHIKQQDPLFKDLEADPRFYFVHKYFVWCEDRTQSLATANYGCEIDAVVHHENVWGTQFHPEKSHKFGLRLLQNFVEYC